MVVSDNDKHYYLLRYETYYGEENFIAQATVGLYGNKKYISHGVSFIKVFFFSFLLLKLRQKS